VINRIILSLATANDGWGLGTFSSLLQGQDTPLVVYFRSNKIPLRSCLLALYIFWHCTGIIWWIKSFSHSFASFVSLLLSIYNTLSDTHALQPLSRYRQRNSEFASSSQEFTGVVRQKRSQRNRQWWIVRVVVSTASCIALSWDEGRRTE
jgi:hypothetical protein